MNTRHLLATAAALSLAAVASLGQPAAAGNPKLSVAGIGTAAATANGHGYAGTLHGTPFPGDFTGTMTVADGSMPALGECEPGRASLHVQSDRGRHYELVSDGEVCAWFLPLGVMHQFTGRWTVSSTDVRRLARADGLLDIRILNGVSDVYATDS